ncbi:MAG: glucose-6-phosphate isomerase [Burkholderiaceae bacterium]
MDSAARSQLPQWRALAAHRRALDAFHIGDALAADPTRAQRWTLEAAGLAFDLSRHRATEETRALLADLAHACEVERWRERLFAGEPINITESRAAWHTSLRKWGQTPFSEGRKKVSDPDFLKEVSDPDFLRFADALREDRSIERVVCVGIGGSDLGPRLVTYALGEQTGGPDVRFVANIDPVELDEALAGARPEATLLVVISKSFTTLETLENARAALAWMRERAPALDVGKHLAAVTAQPERARHFGVPRERIFAFPEWVGGRYSVWSACGLPIAIAHGRATFERLLAGAAAADAHFLDTPLERNVPVQLALLGVWYVNFWGVSTRAVMPYAQRLRHLPAYLQQLEMESNGKRVDRAGRPLDYDTAPVVWGGVGTTAQHSAFQLLHQGTHWSPVDFVTCAAHAESPDERERLLYANALAQADALAIGDRVLDPAARPTAPYAQAPGNRPSTFVALPRIDAFSLGALLAIYEHRTFVQGVVWNINSFDQWGVEIGKRLLSQRLQRT